jgi:predicted transposase/invertase (TIGR01784 family)
MTYLLDPKLDYIFKNIFGTEKNKPLLVSLLNSLLKNNPHIKDLQLENTEITKILEEDKASRLDIKATSDDDTIFDIEIQVRNTGDIPQRAFHYLANMMPKAVESGESYRGAHVIGIWILGKNVTDRHNAVSEAYMTFQLNNPDPYQILTDSARIFFVELEKFDPKTADRRDMLTRWLSFLKDPILMDESFLQTKEVKTAMDTLKYISADDEIRAISDLRQRTINDHNSEITVAREEGREEGISIGEEKGKIEMAKNLLSAGIDIETIAKVSGLSIDEIKASQKSS